MYLVQKKDFGFFVFGLWQLEIEVLLIFVLTSYFYLFRFADYPTNIVLARRYSRQLMKLGVYCLGIDSRKRRFACTGRSPEDKGKNMSLLNRESQRFTARDQMRLADEFVEALWPDAIGERFHGT